MRKSALREPQLLSSDAGHARVAVPLPGLANHLQVQLVRLSACGGHCSVYAVYHEESMSFEASAAFESDPTVPLDRTLLAFAGTQAFHAEFATPLARAAHRHFGRPAVL